MQSGDERRLTSSGSKGNAVVKVLICCRDIAPHEEDFRVINCACIPLALGEGRHQVSKGTKLIMLLHGGLR